MSKTAEFAVYQSFGVIHQNIEMIIFSVDRHLSFPRSKVAEAALELLHKLAMRSFHVRYHLCFDCAAEVTLTAGVLAFSVDLDNMGQEQVRLFILHVRSTEVAGGGLCWKMECFSGQDLLCWSYSLHALTGVAVELGQGAAQRAVGALEHQVFRYVHLQLSLVHVFILVVDLQYVGYDLHLVGFLDFALFAGVRRLRLQLVFGDPNLVSISRIHMLYRMFQESFSRSRETAEETIEQGEALDRVGRFYIVNLVDVVYHLMVGLRLELTLGTTMLGPQMH